jgi:predicted PurR-regulated permease PerM
MEDIPQPEVDPTLVRMLRTLVTALSVVMIVGFIVLIALFVIRFRDQPAPLPDEISLPDDQKAYAVTRGKDWYLVVTENDEVLVFDASTQKLVQTIQITLPE